ncbi:MAG: efflux RND transporter periplasmic adaptor subunit [Candidatus Wallbacteria bacterium]|nr:efflux RND transporter periplasmic adaptor subunit [Candidatus Wallbacteria bacterium]
MQAKKVRYRSTMNPKETSDQPGKDSMGMEMVTFEVTGNETQSDRVTVIVSPEQSRLIGVKTVKVESMPIRKTIHAAGRVDYAEPNLYIVNTKFGGFIETLQADYTGKQVEKGDPLFSIYSPELIAAEQEYLLVRRSMGSGDAEIVKSPRQKLLYWDITSEQIARLEKNGIPDKTITISSPARGIIVEKSVSAGQKIMAGEMLFKIADLSKVWIYGEIYEYELGFVQNSQEVKFSLKAYPGEEFSGRIDYIYPTVDPETHTIKIRIVAENLDLKLKPEMFTNLELLSDLGSRLAIPTSAVLDAGNRKIAFVDLGGGMLEPRDLKLGVQGNDYYEVLSGVASGETVVVSANFLIDSESSLKAALQQFEKK